jgi:hypothetical protein
MMTRTLVAALAVTASLVVAACGGDTNAPTSSSPGGKHGVDAASKKALLQYAQCMRDHGVDMPDPEFEHGVAIKGPSNENRDPAKLRAAEQACKKYQDKFKPPPASEEEQKKTKEAALKNAQCMRNHGITNFPDPQFDENGGMRPNFDKPNGIDPDSPKFEAAANACEKEAPAGMRFGGGTESGSGQ